MIEIQTLNERIKINMFKIGELLEIAEFPQKFDDSYILIDCAHIYKYINKIGVIKRNNHYREGVPEIELNISSIYLGYFGNGIAFYDYFTNYYIINTNFFKILDNNKVKTYIDRLIELGYNESRDINDPGDIIRDIFKKIRRKYMDLWREIHGKVDMKIFLNMVK